METTVKVEGGGSPGASQPRILVVDAHELIASSLTLALKYAGFQPVATAHPDNVALDGSGGCPGAAAGDIVLIGLLYGDGRTTLPLISPLSKRGCRVVVMTSDQGLSLIGDCLLRGAETVIDKAMSFDRLAEMLRRLLSGGRAMTEDERAALLAHVDLHDGAERALRQPFEALTHREAEVFIALIAGETPKAIAHAHSISINTVRGHIQRILTKLDVRSQREALAMARHAGWP